MLGSWTGRCRRRCRDTLWRRKSPIGDETACFQGRDQWFRVPPLVFVSRRGGGQGLKRGQVSQANFWSNNSAPRRRVGGSAPVCASRGGRFGGAHKASEMIDIGEAIGAWLVIWASLTVLQRFGELRRGWEAAGDPPFSLKIKASAEKDKKTGLADLFQPKRPNGRSGPGAFDDGDMQHLAADLVCGSSCTGRRRGQ